jgi:hypothetical protein
MRLEFATILLLLSCGCADAKIPAASRVLCVSNPAAIPESWQPPPKLKNALNTSPWSAGEAKDAIRAAERGVDELSRFYSHQPAAVAALGDHAVEAPIDVSYAASHVPAFREKARRKARQVLMQLIPPYLDRAEERASCREFSKLLRLTIHPHALFQPGDPHIARMTAQTNAAYAACGSFDAAIGGKYRRTLHDPGAPIDDVWNLVIWSIRFTDAQTVPALVAPPEARELPVSVWRNLADYPLDAARIYRDGAQNEKFYDPAYLATHTAYIPTGYGRDMIYISDAPRLDQFLRENFCSVLQMGELDLTAEFTDLFGDYGRIKETDLQLRDGTCYLLKLFHSSGDSWMAYREPYEHADPDNHDLIHKARTGCLMCGRGWRKLRCRVLVVQLFADG